MVLDDLPKLGDTCASLYSSAMEDLEVDLDSGLEEDELKQEAAPEDSTIFVAFKGDIGDRDFEQKLSVILENVPGLLHMESNKLKLQKIEPWNSVRVTFNIPREAAERLRILAQNNNQQLRDLGILSVQIEGEGAINLALAQSRSQDVRINGPLGANNSVRMEPGFPMQGGQGLIRMSNAAAVMMSQSGSMPSSMVAGGAGTELQPRTPRPSSQPDAMDPLLSGLNIQQQNHPSGSLAPQLHSMQSVPVNRQMNSANFQQLQQQTQLQTRPPQPHQQPQQGIRPSFTSPAQVPVPPGWNQLPSGALQPPPTQGALGTLTVNQGWKKAPLPGQMQQQLQARPSLATVQTPTHPPPPYPFGSQQASQAHSNFPQMSNPGQFTAPQMKSLQGGPSRVPTPLQQPHLTNKSPASSPSSFQQGSPASSPTVNQTQQQMGPRPPQSSTLPQGFQQTVSSPSRNAMVQQGNVPPNFMVMQQQNQGPQGLHPGLGGMPKRLPPGFPAGQANQSFMQGQVPSTAPGTPVNSGAPQLQTSQNMQHTGGQGSGPPQNQMQAPHGPPNIMQTNLMGLHGNMNNQQAGASGVPQVNMGNIQGQPQQGPQSQLMGMHQQIVSSQGQMVNIQAQGSMNPQNQMILSRTQLMPQGQMMVTPQNQNLGPSPQRMTPPKQMISQQGQQMMSTHNQMMGPQGQVLLQPNSMMEQMMTTQMQGNKQPFNAQNQSSVMSGPAQLMRGPTPNMQGNMVQFTGQMMAQQGPVNGNPSQVMGIQGQVLRPTGPGPHMSQQLGDTTTATNNDVNVTQMLPDVPVQQSNMVPSHLQAMQGNNSASGSHFPGHGLPFNSGFSGTPNGNQISCGQNPGFPVNKDVTLTSPLLVNLLQSDISAGHFGVNNKPNSQNASKPKKKKPPRKKKTNQQLEQTNSSEPRPGGLEESDQSSTSGDQGINLDSSGPKLSDFGSRPPGYPSQPVEQRPLQQMPPQLMPHTQQPQQLQQQPQLPPQQAQAPPQTPQQQQQMMMMLMMQQDSKSVRLPLPQGVHPPRGPLNPDAQRMPMQQSGNMPVMVNLQGPGSVPLSPDKQRISLPSNPSLGNNARKMVYQDNVQNPSSSPLGEVSSVSSLPDGGGTEGPAASGAQNNLTSHLVVSQNQLMMTGAKPGPSPLSTTQGTSPQQQSNSLPGSLAHHFPNVATPSQTSRPKTPNRASPRPYYPQTPNNRPPSTEPSEISLSPERLNASIAGLFPPQINIPLPPRPNLSRGFDQQGLNPTTLKAIGQAPSNLTINNQSSFAAPQSHKLESVVNSGKQTNAGGTKRASPSSSRRSSPGSSRKTTPSPGRQNSKAAKLSLATPQNPSLLQNVDMQRNMMVGPASLPTPVTTSFQNNNMLSNQSPAVSAPAMTGIPEDNKESLSVPQDNECQSAQIVQGNKDQPSIELKGIPTPEIKMLVPEEQSKKDGQALEVGKLPVLEESKTMVSPAMREAPTSLSQLLDNSGAPNVTIKPPGLTGLEMAPVVTTVEEIKKVAVIPPLQDASSSKEPSNSHSLPQSNEPCSNPGHQEPGEINSNVTQSVPPVMQRPVSSSISAPLPPNQITVFVTSNPITSSANTSAPLPSHLQPTLVSTVVTMPNVGNKVMVSEGQSAVQSNARPQFITPVFINSSSIIQVMKGSQPSTIPTAPMTSNSSLMPQSVAVVGPLHIPQNIKFSSAPAPPSTSSSSPAPSIPTSRPLVLNPLAPPVQLPSPATTSSNVPSHLPAQPAKDSSPEEAASQSSGSSDQCPATATQPGPVVSPLLSSSPGPGNRRSPVSSSKGKGKVDKIGQLLLTKACKKVTGSLEKGEEQYTLDGEAEGQGLETSVPSNLGTEQSPAELDNKTVTPPVPSLTKQSTSGPGNVSVSAAAASASVSPSLSTSTPPTSALSSVTTPAIPELAPATPSTNGSNHGSLPAEQTGGGLVEDKTGTHQELLQNTASSQHLTQKKSSVATTESTVQRTELETNAPVVAGQSNETKENCEKSKTPSRRNSRTEDSAASQETVENGQRKRSSRPASASSTAKETSASAMQSKRRKSK
ncbi:nuclear receptor coactivator 6 isoform X1 [Meleagris gallopavo]|uniref:nuclear receptor coactivator 6 isoform X1 n=1 Tax=Meleagris gallopavo TaxID=9103 RepID=UPI0005499AA6|nr:nuclear receptor coactivator 6 isoform X1 [Meleagris gallopavo]XP_019477667.1 nuclear receptor coactivator 6 isoform X1 [Meleagris gallopavo]